jgi:peptidoglycan glycosyltransferase
MKLLGGGKESGQNWRSFQRKLWGLRPRVNPANIRIKVIGLLLAASAICASLLYAAKGSHRPPETVVSSPPASQNESSLTLQPPSNGNSPHFEKIQDGRFVEDRQENRLIYTVDPVLQASVNEILHSRHPSFSAFVAVEPKTGKILALASFARQNPEDAGIWQRATYPAASVFKLITAAGALEKGLLNYDSAVSFRGNLYRLGPQKIARIFKRERQTQFDEALGKSNNVVFGRVASQLLGPQALREFSEAFGFNHPIQFDFPLDVSRASIPESPYELARCGAGFGEVTLNPLHAAMIAASIANGGVMMRPYLIEEIIGKNGEKVYQAKPEILSQPIRSKTALDLSRMMLRTVEDGTASKIFHRYGRDLLQKMTICGKTGSLTGDDPPGLYDWFVGFAPGDDPQIAFSVLAINNNHRRIKGAFVAQEALKAFFRQQIN